MTIGRTVLLLIGLVVGVLPAPAQTVAPTDTMATPAVAMTLWPPELLALGYVWTPQFSLSSNSGVGLGAETLVPYVVTDHSGTPPSAVELLVQGTTKGQWRVNLENDLRWGGERYHLRARADWDDFAREFYGLGPVADTSDPDVYRPGSLFLYLEGSVQLTGHVSVGPRVEAHRQNLRQVAPDGTLAATADRGLEPGWAMGYGLIASYDTRDCVLHSCRGVYLQGMTMTFPERPGDHGFQINNLDLRGYLPVGARQTLAAQVLYYGVSGEPPFWRLASLGGRDHTRAYGRDRWLDEALITAQVECRWRTWARLGLVGFVGVAAIASEPTAWQAKYLRPTLGLGLRLYRGGDAAPVPVRLDLAVGYQSVRAILTVGEAF